MKKMKYVRIKEGNSIIIFHDYIVHFTFASLNPVSAGFCFIKNDEVVCFGESISLGLESDKRDSEYATKQYFYQE